MHSSAGGLRPHSLSAGHLCLASTLSKFEEQSLPLLRTEIAASVRLRVRAGRCPPILAANYLNCRSGRAVVLRDICSAGCQTASGA